MNFLRSYSILSTRFRNLKSLIFLFFPIVITGSFTTLLLLGSYLPQYRALALFWSEDGWCISPNSLGNHCFGDFTLPLQFLTVENPWSPENGLAYPFPYHAGILLFFKFGSFLVSSIGFNLVLAIYLAILALSILSPVISLFFAGINYKGVSVLLAMICVSFPFLITIDRGNTVGMAVVGLYFAGAGFLRDKPAWIVIGVSWAAFIRPQYAVLLVLLIILSRLRLFLVTLTCNILALVTPFIFFGNNFTSILTEYLRNIRSFSDYQELTKAFPSNYSLSRFFVLCGQIVDLFIPNNIAPRNLFSSFFENISSYLSICLAICLVVILILKRKEIHPIISFCILLSLTLTIPNVSYAYYSVFVIVIIALVLQIPEMEFLRQSTWAKADDLSKAQVLMHLVRSWKHLWSTRKGIVMAVIAPLLPAVIPLPRSLGYGNGYPSLVAAFWLTVYMQLLRGRFNSSSNANYLEVRSQ